MYLVEVWLCWSNISEVMCFGGGMLDERSVLDNGMCLREYFSGRVAEGRVEVEVCSIVGTGD